MVMVPRTEYERLVAIAREAEEDAGTARLVARARKEIAGGEPLLPKEVVDCLANGQNPIRVLRQFREFTQAELAMAVGIAQGYLSDLEAGKRKGPWELHQKVARVLGVPLELLAPVGVTLAEADPDRIARRRRIVEQTRRERRAR
jgi:DNA-binding XRE family transcriptional regulator